MHEGQSITHIVMMLVFQLALILFVAKVAGELTERVFKQPSVLGELVAGVLISPFLLGQYILIPTLGPLFPHPPEGALIPVSSELYSIAQIAVILLLFIAGLETNLKQFMKYAFPAFVVGVGGVIGSFFLGQVITVLMGFAKHGMMDPAALFMGAILTATSVGITARILSELRKLNTPEGVTIIAAAVVDDVLGIMALALVIAISDAMTGANGNAGGGISWGSLGLIALKAIGFWTVLLVVGILAANSIAKFLRKFRSEGAWLAIGLAICFFFSALAEVFGLAMIIGAYAVGLAMSKTSIAEEMVESFHGLYVIFVPIFFVVTGMMVDVTSMGGALLFGAAMTVAAIFSKVVWCGLPAVGVGFNMLGGWRIGVGMLPRGEVALIIASMGLARGVIGQEIYGVAILVTLVTTLLAPIVLVPLFKNPRSGLWKSRQSKEQAAGS